MSSDPHALALTWLAGRRLTRRELEDRLKRRGISDVQCEETLARMSELGLVDDDRYAIELVAEAAEHGPQGPGKIWARLLRRGFSAETVARAMQSQEWDWLTIARQLAERYDMTDQISKRRFIGRLAREGFPGQVICRFTDLADAGD